MRFSTHRAAVAALALTTALALVGCDDDTPKVDAKPSDKGSSSQSSPSKSPSAEPTVVPETAEAAVGRYEEYLHAVGDSDLDTMCEIAAPAMATVSGDCESNFKLMLSMFSAEQLKALETATIDQGQVTESGKGKVDIPATAVKSDARFASDDLGDVTLSYQDGDWFIVD